MLGQFFNVSRVVSQQLELLGFSGLAEWDDNRECLNLEFWVQTRKGLLQCHCLAQHGQAELDYNARPTQAHIDGAIAYLQDLATRCDQNGFDSNTRGYIHLPTEPALPWQHDDSAVFASRLRSLSFLNAVENRINLPSAFKHLKPKVEKYVRLKLGETQFKNYLDSKASDMAGYWASNVGSLGSSGNIIADTLHSQVAGHHLPSDADKLYAAMKEDILAGFAEGRVRFYDTDYGCGRALSTLLKNANLSHLEKAMPWKTWRHFDFSDAPPLV